MATIADLVLVHVDDRPGFFARIEDISPDVKSGWWRVKMLVLTMPLQVYTWTLDTSQIDGAAFTMGGTPIRLEKVALPVERPDRSTPIVSADSTDSAEQGSRLPEPERGKVVSLLDRKKSK